MSFFATPPANTNLIIFVYDIPTLATALTVEVGKHPKLLCAVMFHPFDDGRDDAFSVGLGPHTFTRQMRSDKAVEQSLSIRNPSCKHTLSAETLEKVGSAFVTD